MEQSQAISKLISEIYQTATDATKLHRVMELIAEEFDADLGLIAFGERKDYKINHMVVTPGEIDAQPGIDFAECFQPWIRNVANNEAGRFHQHEEISAHPSMAHGRARNGLLDDFDFKSGLSAHFHLKKSRYGYLGFCRRDGRPAFDAATLVKLDLLLPHVKQALDINGYLDKLTVLHDVTQDRYQQSSIGVVLMDEQGQVVFSNPIARHLIKEPGGIGVSHGKLFSERSEETAKLERLIKRCVQTANIKGVLNDGFLSISREHLGKPPLSVSISSYGNKLDARTVSASKGRALAIIFDPERRQVTQEYILERLYNLTNAEASLATRLAEGKTLSELAADHEISRETLRSQLKRVFQKTQTKRQSELVRLVLSGPGSLVI